VNTDPNVLVGHGGADDAGVYRISDDSALVLTVDFFTPIVDDPYDYGRVAAVNSLSDVYAMGGRPVVALNVAGFPEKEIPADILAEILRGGGDVAREAGVAIVGGHTIDDKEVKYGLSVVGFVDPNDMVTNAGAKPGDKLVLTKPIGTGVLSTQHMAEKLDEAGLARLVGVMTQLNREASEKMREFGVHACTDVTGFGLLGHAKNIARESDVTIEIDAASVPLIDGALDAARDGYLTGGGNKNRRFLADVLRFDTEPEENLTHLLFDPQTAGGLLVALPAENAQSFVDALRATHPHAAIVGECTAPSDVHLLVR
jgi:selenide,water dikinase